MGDRLICGRCGAVHDSEISKGKCPVCTLELRVAENILSIFTVKEK